MTRALIGVVSILVALSLSGCQSGTQFRVRWRPNAVLDVSAGKVAKRLLLAADVEGCLDRLFDPTTNERYGSGEGHKVILDVTESGPDRFVLIGAAAAPNCNVQGQCGAADDNITLIWLHLDAQLAIVKKQVVLVEACPTRYLDRAGQPADWFERLSLTNGLLTLKFAEMIQSGDEFVESTSTLRYDTRAAQAGMQIERAK